jgi:hypothetical protein
MCNLIAKTNGADCRSRGCAAILVAVISFVRGLPWFIAARPKTSLRVLCLMAFDTLHVLRYSKRLPARKIKILAALLDFAACANAAFDNKEFCRQEFQRTQRMLEEAGFSSHVLEYLRRLRDIESNRPSHDGDHRPFQKVASYRESVVRLSLGFVASTALDGQCLEDGVRATYCDDDFEILFRIIMQCQIIDDVLDYSKDVSAGLPSFLTAVKSLSQAFECTRVSSIAYANVRDLRRTANVAPFRMALFFVSACARAVVLLGRGRFYGIGRRRPEQAVVRNKRSAVPARIAK